MKEDKITSTMTFSLASLGVCVCGSIALKILLGTNTENRNADTFNVHHDMRMQALGLVKCQGLSKIGHKNCVNVFQAKQQLFFLNYFFFMRVI